MTHTGNRSVASFTSASVSWSWRQQPTTGREIQVDLDVDPPVFIQPQNEAYGVSAEGLMFDQISRPH